MAGELEDLLGYYQREMHYLKQRGKQFSDTYPDVAKKLDWQGQSSADPHVERLIESFAFLTARLQRNIDDRFSRFTSLLLENLYPQFIRPYPSASIAQIKLSPNLGKVSLGYTVKRHTSLMTHANTGGSVKFMTCYPVQLWPIQVEDVSVVDLRDFGIASDVKGSPSGIRIRVKRFDGAMRELPLHSLRFYLSGDTLTVNALYESFFGFDPINETPMWIKTDQDDAPLVRLPKGTINPVGFGEDEELVPYATHGHPAYHILQDYFVFPKKFHFVDIQNLSTERCQSYFDLFIPLTTQIDVDKLLLRNDTIQLGCTPIINLFRKTSEPMRVDHRQVDYRLVADMRHEESTDIHMIEQVTGISDQAADSHVYEPYFSFSHSNKERDQQTFWVARQDETERRHTSYRDISLSFVDFDLDPLLPNSKTIFAHLLCTNRNLAAKLQPGSQLHVDGDAPSVQVYCIDRPTPQLEPAVDAETQWKLISQLSLSHLGVAGEKDALLMLRHILKTYSQHFSSQTALEIGALEGVEIKTVTRRVMKEAWRGFVQGLSVKIAVNDNQSYKVSLLLFSKVMKHFLSLLAPVNGFVEVTLFSQQRQEVWKRWPIQESDQNRL